MAQTQIVTGSNAPQAAPAIAQQTPPADEYSTPLPQGASVGDTQSAPQQSQTGQQDQSASPDDEYSTPIPSGASVSQPSDDTSSNTMASEGHEEPGFWSRAGEVSGLTGLDNLATNTVQSAFSDKTKNFKPIDEYKNAVSMMRNGDWRGAVESADKLVRFLTLGDPNSPLIDAAKEIIMHPIEAAKKKSDADLEVMKSGSLADKALTAIDPVGLHKTISDGLTEAVNDAKQGHLFDAATALSTAPMRNETLSEIPLVGDAIRQFGEDADKDKHADNYRALYGDIAGAIAAIFGGKSLHEEYDVPSGPSGGATNAAKTFDELSERAERSPTEQGVFNAIQDRVSNAKKGIEDIFDRDKESLTNQKQTELDSADTQRETDQDDAKARKEASVSDLDRRTKVAQRESQSQLDNDKDTQRENLADARNTARTTASEASKDVDALHADAQSAIHGNLTSNLADLAENSLEPEELLERSHRALSTYRDTASVEFENAINGDEGIAPRLRGQTVAYSDSAASRNAREALAQPTPEDSHGTQQLKGISGDKLDKNVQQFLTDQSRGVKVISEAVPAREGRPAVPEVTEPLPPKTIDDLINERQAARKAASNYAPGDPNARALRSFINGIDQDIDALAGRMNDPEAVRRYQNARNTYMQKMQVIGSDAIDGLKGTGNPYENLDDVTKFLTRSAPNQAGRLAAVRALMPEAMNDLARTRVAALRDMAVKNPNAFIREWKSTSPTLRDHFYGPDLSLQLDSFVAEHEQSLQYAQQLADEMKASNGTALRNQNQRLSLDNTASTTDLTRAHQDRVAAINDSANREASQIDAAHVVNTRAIRDRYDGIVRDINDKYARATNARGLRHDADMAPYNNSFMKRFLSPDRANDPLMAGDVDLADVKNLKNITGDKWDEFSHALFSRGIANASINGRFSPSAFMDWWGKMKPEVRDALFDSNRATTLENFHKTVADIEHAASYQRLIRAGAITTGSLGAAAAGGLLGHAIGPIGEAVAAMGSLYAGSKTGLIRSFVDWASTHPAAWKAVKVVDAVPTAVKNGASNAGKAARGTAAAGMVTPRRRADYDGLAGLGGR